MLEISVNNQHKLEKISAGQIFTCGLRPNGDIQCWGENCLGQSSPPSYVFWQVSESVDNEESNKFEYEQLLWVKTMHMHPQQLWMNHRRWRHHHHFCVGGWQDLILVHITPLYRFGAGCARCEIKDEIVFAIPWFFLL